MQSQTQLERDQVVEQKIQKLRELYADAPELGRIAFEKGLPDLKRELAAATGTQNAGRIGARQGKVSELTGIIPFARPYPALKLFRDAMYASLRDKLPPDVWDYPTP
jgi:hypothetical protein